VLDVIVSPSHTGIKKLLRSEFSASNWPPAFDDFFRSCGGAMGSETQLSPDRLNWVSLAADALELARQGHERNEALKLAGLLRRAADARDWCFRNGAGDQSKAESPK
jgi:hypothetical protein